MKRNLKNNIVIVCEGTETEVGYLKELVEYSQAKFADRFSQIKIIPSPEELKNCESRKKNSKKRKLKDVGVGGWYYTVGEPDKADYEKYRQQPTRYVREAQIYLADGSFSEAWAVYDNDNFPDHENARKLAESQSGLHIAYSSVSIEEWLLLHFEQNQKAFERSVCKENKKDILCGTGRHPNDCQGEKCVGGLLRKQFLPSYEKTQRGLFSRLLPRLTQARARAAWTQRLQPDKKIWERNPYTDFNRLIERLLGLNSYKWYGPGDTFRTQGTELRIEKSCLTNCGKGNFIDSAEIVDTDFAAIRKERINIGPGQRHELAVGEYLILQQKGDMLIISSQK